MTDRGGATGPQGRVKACTECRQQKLRCDAHIDYSKPCSRCSKMSLSCVVTRSFNRSRPQTKAELLGELDALKRKRTEQHVRQRTKSETGPSPRPPLGPRAEEDTCGNDFDSTSTVQSKARLCNDSTVESIGWNKIDECFNLFFEHHADFVPGLCDPSLSPVQYYDLSPFLFWAIVETGARRHRDPVLLERVAKHIMEIALPSLYSISRPIPAIQAVLVLCLWPLPISTMWKDPSHALIGAAVQLAVQNGLHVVGHEQDFARTLSKSTESERLGRARLWIHCLIVFQRRAPKSRALCYVFNALLLCLADNRYSTSMCDGLPCWSIPTLRPLSGDEESETFASPDLLYRYRLHRLQTTALGTMLQESDVESGSTKGSVGSLIDVFDTQLTEIRAGCPSDMNNLVLSCARLSLRAFHFFQFSPTTTAETDRRRAGLVILYSICCSLLARAAGLDAQRNLALYAPQYIHRMISLAAYCILKMTRSRLRWHIDIEAGEEAIFTAIRFTRKASLQNNDLDAKNGNILAQLWGSERAFRKSEGEEQDGLWLMLRSRLSMSVAFDCFWWWRAEFGGLSNPYTHTAEHRPSANEPDDGFVPTINGRGVYTDQNADFSHLLAPNDELRDPLLNFTSSILPTLGHTSGAESGPDYTARFGETHFPTSFGSIPDWQWAADFTFPEMDPLDMQIPMIDTQD